MTYFRFIKELHRICNNSMKNSGEFVTRVRVRACVCEIYGSTDVHVTGRRAYKTFLAIVWYYNKKEKKREKS